MGDLMFERWRHPVKILHVETDTGHATDMGDGRVMQDLQIHVDPADTERFRTGYACIRCFEGQPEPFPERCYVCEFPMRDYQMSEFGRQYAGIEDLRRADYDEEEARMQEENERRGFRKGSRIWVPDKGA